MEITITYLLVYIIEGLILWQYASNFLPPKYNRTVEVIVLTCLYGGLFAVSYIEFPILNAIAFTIANLIFIAALYQIKWYAALFHSFICTIAMLAGEIAIQNIISYYAADFFSEGLLFRLIILAIFSKTIYFLIVYTLSHLFKERNSSEGRQTKTTFILAFVPMASACVLLTLSTICLYTPLSLSLNWMASISAVLILIVNIIVFAINHYNQKKSREFTEMQLLLQKENDSMEYYKMLLQQNENQSILIHDIKNHLQSISLLNESGEQEKISSYIDHLIHSSALQDSLHLCNHEMLNAILCRFQRQCQEKQIAFHTDIRKGTVDFVSDNDITSLFCNLLENALESASKMQDARIELSVCHQDNSAFTVLTMTNSCLADPFSGSSRQLESTKQDKVRHGYGIKSIRRIVEKYHGDMRMYYEDKTRTFHTIITLKEPL